MKILKLTLIFCLAFSALFAQKKKVPAKKKPVVPAVVTPAATPPAAIDSVHYWISNDQLSVDPTKYSLASLTSKIKEGTVTSSTLVVKTKGKWQIAAAYSELAELIKAATPQLQQKAFVPPALPKIDSLQSKQVKDGVQATQETKERTFEPYAAVRPQDILFSKRIWRNVDFREKLNQPFVAQESPFAKIIHDLIQSGKIVAYSKNGDKEKGDEFGDKFSTTMTIKDALAAFESEKIDPNDKSKWVDSMDANGKLIKVPPPNIDKTAWNEKAIGIQIKEDWVFDKIRQELEPRIVGIALLKKTKTTAPSTNIGVPGGPNNGIGAAAAKFDTAPPEIMFWLNFEQIRPQLHKAVVLNNYNDAFPLSFDDLLVKRTFASYIVKESNTKNIPISTSFTDPQDRLRESERIKKALMDWEHDLWSY
ncbi:MAG: gliding motility protein GldN [Sphingobacteriales bacterium]|nr:gliding motility protein GldN [Sphingobacteriales bacterium]